MQAAESAAVEREKSLLVLDTAAEDGASGFYEKLGYKLTGIIPDFALKPHGGLTGTMVYWKRLYRSANQYQDEAEPMTKAAPPRRGERTGHPAWRLGDPCVTFRFEAGDCRPASVCGMVRNAAALPRRDLRHPENVTT